MQVARIRSIKPEFPQSESMGRVSRDARLLFVMLWPICDDHGRTRAASRMLASLLFPYDDDAPALVPGWLDELEREGCIQRYEVNGSTFLEVRNWLMHQKIDKPSKPQFPDPPGTLAKPREDSSLEGKGKEGKGEEAPPDEPALPASPVVVLLTLNDGSEFPITQAQADEFASLYPAVDVPQELRSMRAWAIANPQKRKTKTGALRFVNTWLAREQDKGGKSAPALREPAALPRLQA